MIDSSEVQVCAEAVPFPGTAPRCKVLVIDDSSFVRKLLKAVLGDLHCDVATAADGLSGLQLALEGSFEVIIVDSILPVLNGKEVCRRIAELPPERRPLTIFQSMSFGNYQERSEALASGADVLMMKEPGAENIVARVRRFLESRPTPA